MLNPELNNAVVLPSLTTALEDLITDLMIQGFNDVSAIRLVNHMRMLVRTGQNTPERLLTLYQIDRKHLPTLNI